MDAAEEPLDTPGSRTPGAAPPRCVVDGNDELALCHGTPVTTHYAANEYGANELRLFYGDREISFDDASLFAFGETLAAQTRFKAYTAVTWGHGYDWPRVQGLLEQLIEEGLLQFADGREATRPPGAKTSLAPHARAAATRSWAECEALYLLQMDTAPEPGYLELVLPVFRITAMLMAAKGRAPGEAGKFAPAMTRDAASGWRTCDHAGNLLLAPPRLDTLSLQDMQPHWGLMLALLQHVRETYLQRYPQARLRWTVWHLERLATVALAVPGYALLRAHAPVNRLDLHPALSGMAYWALALRDSLQTLRFDAPGKAVTLDDSPLSGAALAACMLKRYPALGHESSGNGPVTTMLHEFAGVLTGETAAPPYRSAALAPDLAAAANGLDIAIDYGLYGLQAYAAVLSLWPVMSHTYEQLVRFAGEWAAQPAACPNVRRFYERLQHAVDNAAAGTAATSPGVRAQRRAALEKIQIDLYDQCAAGLRNDAVASPLRRQFSLGRQPLPLHAEQQLRDILRRHFGCAADAPAPHLDQIAACLAGYITQEQAMLRVAYTTQRYINALLGRHPPARPFSAREIDMPLLLRDMDAGRCLPYLCDELQDILGIRMLIEKDRIDIVERPDGADA